MPKVGRHWTPEPPDPDLDRSRQDVQEAMLDQRKKVDQARQLARAMRWHRQQNQFGEVITEALTRARRG
jgi:hypothetical protein